MFWRARFYLEIIFTEKAPLDDDKYDADGNDDHGGTFLYSYFNQSGIHIVHERVDGYASFIWIT